MNQSNMFAEKRHHPRVSLEIPLKCRFMDGALNVESLSEARRRVMNSTSRDVSLEGMKIQADIPLNVGDIMAVDFSLPENPASISAFAEVVWIEQEIVGIHFLALKEQDLESLKVTLAKVSPDQ
jgi:hypothetical protein